MKKILCLGLLRNILTSNVWYLNLWTTQNDMFFFYFSACEVGLRPEATIDTKRKRPKLGYQGHFAQDRQHALHAFNPL
jgi:hypothetical protein